MLLVLVDQLCFYLIEGSIGLVVSLAISIAETINKEITVGFSKYSDKKWSSAPKDIR